MFRFFLFFLFLIQSQLICAEPSKNSRLMESDALKQQRIFIDSANISFREFVEAYTSQSLIERRYAEMYLLGVLDLTEGVSWCNYRTIKTGTISEIIYPLIVSKDKAKENRRAAVSLSEILKQSFPCENKK